MQAVVPTTWAAQVLRHLPGPLLRALDGWSYRLAQRRALERQRKAMRGRTPKLVQQATHYHLKPWRD